MRPIAPEDKARLAAGVAALSPESQYGRFLTGKSSLTPAELRYLTEVDGRDHIALLVLDSDGELVAVGRIVRDAARPTPPSWRSPCATSGSGAASAGRSRAS